MVEKITMMPQRSTRRRPTNFKMLVCQSLDVSTLETVCLTTIKCYIKSSKCPEERVNSLLKMLSKSVTFCIFDFYKVV